MKTLPQPEKINFNCGTLPGTAAVVDSGGWTYFYLNEYENSLRTKNISFVQGIHFYCPYRYTTLEYADLSEAEIISNLTQRNFTPHEIELVLQKPDTIELLFDNHFLHYRCGTNYEKYSREHLNKKDKILNSFFNKLLED